jgi:hypothetical protein
MKVTVLSLAAGVVSSTFAMVQAQAQSIAQSIDPAAVQFTVPAAIKWVRNAAGTNDSAMLFGDPAKVRPGSSSDAGTIGAHHGCTGINTQSPTIGKPGKDFEK